MKKILFPLLALIVSLTTQALRADNAPRHSVSKIVLNEKNANTPEMPIDVPLVNSGNSELVISLQGIASYSEVYSSGSGNRRGYRWEYDNGGVGNDVLTMISGPVESDSFFKNNATVMGGWITKEVPYKWTFVPKEVGLTTLTFRKYHYSNAKIQNLDGSSPWKDPVETLEFTINVVDGAAPTSSN